MDTTILGETGGRLLIAILGVGAGLLVLVAVLWWMKNRPSSPFIRGGRNRQPRLAVLDAAAVDTRRRLVLVRRDDVEHLILIGGPTDVVIESRIAPMVQDTTDRAASGVAATSLEDMPVERRSTAATSDRLTALDRPAPVPPAIAQQRAVTAASQDPTISNVGAALYGEHGREAPRQETRPATAAPERRPATTADAARRETARPEDILEAARLRVMPQTAQPVPDQRPAADTATRNPAPLSSDFERMLDAEISGNLQKIAPETRESINRLQPATTVRIEGAQPGTAQRNPQPAAAERREPSLEEEMFRLLEERDGQRTR